MSTDPRTIPPWTMMPCDQCGAEYQASRTQPVTATRFFCGDCEVWERATAEAEQRCAADITRLTEEVGRRDALLSEGATRIDELRAERDALLAERTPRPVPEGEWPRFYYPAVFNMNKVELRVDGKDDHPSEESARIEAIAHRNAVAADCYPELAARMKQLEAENRRSEELLAAREEECAALWDAARQSLRRVGVDPSADTQVIARQLREMAVDFGKAAAERDAAVEANAVLRSQLRLDAAAQSAPSGLDEAALRESVNRDYGWEQCFTDDDEPREFWRRGSARADVTMMGGRPFLTAYWTDDDGVETDVDVPFPIAEHLLGLSAAATRELRAERDRLAADVERLRGERDTPETQDFLRGAALEADHQVARWGVEHDAGKQPEDWFWLLGYLAGKALAAAKSGDVDKAAHHTISSAAVLLNWHRTIVGKPTAMRPGIEPPAPTPDTSGPPHECVHADDNDGWWRCIHCGKSAPHRSDTSGSPEGEEK